jgi:hypothetical protein
MKKENFDIKTIIDVYEKKQGNVTETAKSLNITRKTFYDWLQKDKELKREIEIIDDSLLDFAESQLRLLMRGIPKLDIEGKLIDWIVRPDNTSIIFYLKTKGKKRGYIEKTEIDHRVETGKSLNIVIE